MAYEAKMKPTDNSVTEFIEQIESKKKKEDAYRLLEIFKEVTGMEPVMWGSSIIGFGKYKYTYASGHSGEANLAGFSPRKTAHTLYIMGEEQRTAELLGKLGKHRSSKACVYVNKLEDIDVAVLKQMIKESMEHTLAMYPDQD